MIFDQIEYYTRIIPWNLHLALLISKCPQWLSLPFKNRVLLTIFLQISMLLAATTSIYSFTIAGTTFKCYLPLRQLFILSPSVENPLMLLNASTTTESLSTLGQPSNTSRHCDNHFLIINARTIHRMLLGVGINTGSHLAPNSLPAKWMSRIKVKHVQPSTPPARDKVF